MQTVRQAQGIGPSVDPGLHEPTWVRGGQIRPRSLTSSTSWPRGSVLEPCPRASLCSAPMRTCGPRAGGGSETRYDATRVARRPGVRARDAGGFKQRGYCVKDTCGSRTARESP